MRKVVEAIVQQCPCVIDIIQIVTEHHNTDKSHVVSFCRGDEGVVCLVGISGLSGKGAFVIPFAFKQHCVMVPQLPWSGCHVCGRNRVQKIGFDGAESFIFYRF